MVRIHFALSSANTRVPALPSLTRSTIENLVRKKNKIKNDECLQRRLGRIPDGFQTKQDAHFSSLQTFVIKEQHPSRCLRHARYKLDFTSQQLNDSHDAEHVCAGCLFCMKLCQVSCGQCVIYVITAALIGGIFTRVDS